MLLQPVPWSNTTKSNNKPQSSSLTSAAKENTPAISNSQSVVIKQSTHSSHQSSQDVSLKKQRAPTMSEKEMKKEMEDRFSESQSSIL